ncbi:MAG: NTP transferase domain-containing protein [Thermodesulfobacteriota bacterium]|nr:NTP transferase domain-containing protein [Thermodesulfobacteriota bacterium]
MKKVAIIPCAGRKIRWKGYLGVEKQLAPVNSAGETILGRTVKLLNENGVNDIYVMTDKPEIRQAPLDVTFVSPASSDHLTSTIMSSKSQWSDRTMIVLGDVYFSRGAIKRIVKDETNVRFFGVMETSPLVKMLAARPEVFALAFNETEAEPVTKALKLSTLLASVRDAGSERWFWTVQRIKYIAKLDLHALCDGVTRTQLVRTFYGYNHRPEPPRVLRKSGFKQRPFWKIAREASCGILGGSRWFGKLWGTYALLAKIDLAEGGIRSRVRPGSSLFEEMNEFAQDCDVPSDYDRLMLLLDLFEHL